MENTTYYEQQFNTPNPPPPNFNYPPQPPQYVRQFTTADSVLAWLCFLLGYLFCRAFPVYINPFGALLVIVSAYIVSFVYLKIKHHKIGFIPFLVATSAIVLSMSLFFCNNSFLQKLCFTYAVASLGFFIYASTGNRIEKGFTSLIAIDYFKALFIMPFCTLGTIYKAAFTSKRTAKPVLKLLLGIAIAIIPTAIVTALLSYDEGFRDIISKVFDFDISTVFSHFASAGFGIPIAMYFFGAFVSGRENKCRDVIRAESAHKAAKAVKIAPPITVVAALLPVLLIYVVFFISQWKYYLSAFTGILPDGFTYANYAREGFFQLLAVSIINLILIIICVMFAKNSRALLVSMTSLFSISTIILIATALSKMVLYIDTYGLTPKRVYASWFMVLIALTFIIITLSQIIPRMSALAWSGVIWVIMFALISLSNVDGIIADYNVDCYISEKLDDVDVEMLINLGDPAVPALSRLKIELPKKSDEYIEVTDHLNALRKEYKNITVFEMTLPTLKAIQTLKP